MQIIRNLKSVVREAGADPATVLALFDLDGDRLAGLATGLAQQFGDIGILAFQRNVERRFAGLQRLVRVGAIGQQQFDDIDVGTA